MTTFVQIVEKGDTSSSLAVHVEHPDEPLVPACHQPIKPWMGKEMVTVRHPGPATCQRAGCLG